MARRTLTPRSRFWLDLTAITAALGFVVTAMNAPWLFAQDKAAPANTKSSETQINDTGKPSPLPEWLQKLKLTSDQTTKIQETIRDYDRSIEDVWNQFHDRYMQTICMESQMLSAIEDQLSDQQRTSIREHRRRTGRHERTTIRETVRQTKAESPAKERNATDDRPETEVDVDVPDVGVTLTHDQESAADKIHQKYRSHFRTVHREIRQLHNRLMALETEKIAEIEKFLTKDQLAQLRSERQNPAELAKATATSTNRPE